MPLTKIIKAQGYSVYIGPEALADIPATIASGGYTSCIVLCDTNTKKHCLPLLLKKCPALRTSKIITMPAGEKHKTLATCTAILKQLLHFSASRHTLLINLGGGVVSDTGGFCASVFKRGIDFVNIPTSLLAMADASVGGKTGVDFEGNKNLVGTFNQPAGVFIYPQFLTTLPKRHKDSGMAEVVKIALAANRTLWKQLSNTHQTPEKIIEHSVRLKNSIVAADPHDRAQRKILNLGHSIGHALEAFYLKSKRPMLHGECVVAGILTESHIAVQKGLLTKVDLQEIVAVVCKLFKLQIPPFPLAGIAAFLHNDKKNKNGQLLFALPTAIGTCAYNVPVSLREVRKAVEFYNSLVK